MKSHQRLLHWVNNLAIALALPFLFTQTLSRTTVYAISFGTPAEFLDNVSIQGSLSVASSASFLAGVQFAQPTTFLDNFSVQAAAVFEQTMRVLGEVTFEQRVTHHAQTIFQGSVLFPTNMAGTVSVPARVSRIRVTFPTAFDATPIITISQVLANPTNRNVALSSYVSPFITDVSPTGFTIILNRITTIPLQFNWIAIEIGN